MAVHVESRNCWSDSLEALRVGGSLRLRGLGWHDYIRISEKIGERRYLTYFHKGEMEIVRPYSPLLPSIYLLDRFVCWLSDELVVPRRSVGMSTLRRDDLNTAIEPCRAFYFSSEEKIRGRMELDLSVTQPPDLSIEVDVGQSVEMRMCVYAQIGVPEIWRFDGEKLTVNQLVANGEYIVVDGSRFFPMIPMSAFTRFVGMHGTTDDTSLKVAFIDWVRQQVATTRPADTGIGDPSK